MGKFSVFLPVRNGWPYVQACVESVLAQSCPDLELIILDNASTDQTLDWLSTVNDDRLRVKSSTESLSIVESWARILDEPKGEYMTLIGHDDILDKDFLKTISALIDKHPDASLYQTGSRLINADGGVIRPCRKAAEIEVPRDYLAARFSFQRDVFGTGYVMRSVKYDEVGGIPAFEKLFFADDALWLTMMKGSYKAYDPTELFGVRIHAESESASLPSAWGGILAGLSQFNGFLQEYLRQEPSIAQLVAEQNPQFQLAYHQNALIFALVEASTAGHTIKASVTEKIRASLVDSAPSVADSLHESTKVRLIAALNKSALRSIVPFLWKSYNLLKNKTS